VAHDPPEKLVLSRAAGLGLATAIIAGTTVGLIAPAGAAVKAKCTTGTWKLVRENGLAVGKDEKGKKYKYVTKGAGGIKVKFSGTKATYNFTGSKKETLTGYNSDGIVDGWTRYTGSLKVTVKLSGDQKGIFTVKNRTAKGNAVGHFPSGESFDVDASLRKKSGSQSLIASGNGATFTCSAKKLVMVSALKFKELSDRTTLTYRRV
jgi:hypothetical protein